MNGTRSRADNKCHACNKTFSKPEHLSRHIRGHEKQKPYKCRACGRVYSRSDVLRRHEKSHHNNASLQSPPSISRTSSKLPRRDSFIMTPSSESIIQQIDSAHSTFLPSVVTDNTHYIGESSEPQIPEGISLHDPVLGTSSGDWLLGANLDVDALDLTLSSAISEWAQLPVPPSLLGPGLSITEPTGLGQESNEVTNMVSSIQAVDVVEKAWFTYLSPPEEHRSNRQTTPNQGVSFGGEKLQADDRYRVGLSLELQHRQHDEALPSSEQLNLFAKLFFSRFLPLFPVIHAPTFRLSAENTLLFLSLCSVGSLFVGSSNAVAHGTRIFERLNKAILASWESILSRSRAKALSMVQAAIFGQTFAILSGRPRDLVLADVLHGTVMSWARESNKYSIYGQNNHGQSNPVLDSSDIAEQWHRWIEKEQRNRVEIALNIHDAELSSLLHHDPIRKHRLSQFPHLASDDLFAATTAAKWASLYQQNTYDSFSNVHIDDTFQNSSGLSRFSAYGILEGISASLNEARQANSLDHNTSQHLSNLLIQWWRKYSPHFFQNENADPFSLPILWHTVYMSLYADIDLLEQAIGRNGQARAIAVSATVHEWASSLEASKCLAHTLLIQRYLERMQVSSEPAIHVPRSLFTAALAWLCFTRIGCQQAIDIKAFEAPEIRILNSEIVSPVVMGQPSGSYFGDVNHLYRLVDLLQRVNRWSISKTFASVLCIALAERGEK